MTHATIPLDLSTREYFDRRVGAMQDVRQNFIPHYRDLSDFVAPRRGRFFVDDVNKGSPKYQAIINSHATQALRTARSGMFAGTMSPSRPWFRVGVLDPDLMEQQDVKVWLETVEKILRDIFNQSNLYNMAPVMLGELLQFSTGCMTQVDDFQDVARFYTHTVGSYMIAQNERFVVETVAREFKRSVEQLVAQFSVPGGGSEALANLSITVRNAWDQGNYDTMVPVINFIEKNPDAQDGGIFANRKPFRSVTYETGGNDKKFLGIAGYEEFPAYVPRWEVTGEDTYGTDCPGMTALGDVKGLQVEERHKAMGIEKMVNPPLQGPPGLRNVPSSSLPGSLTTYSADGTHVLKPVHEVRPQIGELVQDIDKVERRIDAAYYVPLFKAITNLEGIQPKNELELTAVDQERLLELGPVLERVHGDFLAKMVERTFNQAVRAGILPDAPEVIQEQKLSVRFISSLAIAQRAVSVGGIERVMGFASSLAEIWPAATKKIDAMQAIDEYGQAIGVPAKLIVPDDVVAQQLAEEKAEQQALQMQEAVKAVGPTAVQGAQAIDAAGE